MRIDQQEDALVARLRRGLRAAGDYLSRYALAGLAGAAAFGMIGVSTDIAEIPAMSAFLARPTELRVDGPEPRYAEGRIGVVDGAVTIDGLRVDDDAVALQAFLRGYEGLPVGLEYNERGARIVGPAQDEWRRLSASIPEMAGRLAGFNLVAGDLIVPQPPLENPPSRTAPFPRPELLSQYIDSMRSVAVAYQAARSTDPFERIQARTQLVREMKRAVSFSIQVADAAVLPEQRDAALAIATSYRAAYLDTELKNYDGALLRPGWFYRRLADQLDSAVGIRIGTRTDGTGFVVAPGWVVTAEHVVRNVIDFGTLRVVFRFEDDAFGATPAGMQCAVDDIRRAGLSTDLAALHIVCPQGERQPDPLRLTTRVANLDEGVYVVGHPNQQPKRVADYGAVRYPHRVTRHGLNVLRARLTDPTEVATFDAAYHSCEPTWYCYLSSRSRWNAGASTNAEWPTLGFVANTYPGNSGSPVYYVSDHTVAGLLFGGRTDYLAAGGNSFLRHEGAVPSPVIVEWLRKEGIPITTP